MKLYLVTREDLSHGQRAAQLCHVLRSFVDQHPDVDRAWFEKSNTLVLLEVPDEIALAELAERAAGASVPFSVFREPDMGDRVTAVALAPSGRKLCNRLRLAFSARWG